MGCRQETGSWTFFLGGGETQHQVELGHVKQLALMRSDSFTTITIVLKSTCTLTAEDSKKFSQCVLHTATNSGKGHSVLLDKIWILRALISATATGNFLLERKVLPILLVVG